MYLRGWRWWVDVFSPPSGGCGCSGTQRSHHLPQYSSWIQSFLMPININNHIISHHYQDSGMNELNGLKKKLYKLLANRNGSLCLLSPPHLHHNCHQLHLWLTTFSSPQRHLYHLRYSGLSGLCSRPILSLFKLHWSKSSGGGWLLLLPLGPDPRPRWIMCELYDRVQVVYSCGFVQMLWVLWPCGNANWGKVHMPSGFLDGDGWKMHYVWSIGLSGVRARLNANMFKMLGLKFYIKLIWAMWITFRRSSVDY